MRKLLAIMCVLLPFLVWGEEVSKVKVLKKGDRCPRFVFKDAGEKEVSLEQFKGKYVVIDVWVSWCYPCKQEFPNLKKLEDKYKDKNIVFVGISCDQSERRWRNELGFQREVVAYQWWIGGDESFMRAFKIVAIPRLILLDKEGRVLNLSLPKPSDRKFEKILSKLKDL